MTPEERNLVIELFDRLGTLEDARRDPDAERLIRDGLQQAPNAVYSLVQTVLVQDEALKRADARLRELEDGAEAAPRDTSFLGNMRQMLGGRGSVPSVRGPSAPAGMSPAWQSGAPAAPMQPQQPAPAPSGFGGGSFLGNAAAAAAGVIGGSLLLSSIRSMMGGQSGSGQSGGHGALDSLAGGNSPWGSGSGNNSDLARQAGIDDIGRSPAADGSGDGQRAGLLDNNDLDAQGDGADPDAFFGDDGDMDFGDGGGEE
jgi:uncharacterized protein